MLAVLARQKVRKETKLTVSTLKPMVGMVVTTSPSLSLYKMVVLPAASRPTIRMRMSFLPKNLVKSFETLRPMVVESGHGNTKGLRKESKEKIHTGCARKMRKCGERREHLFH